MNINAAFVLADSAAGTLRGTATLAAPASGAETLIGTAGADTLEGGKGDDLIDGGFSADLLIGGAGQDSILWNPGGGSDTVDGGKGDDTLFFNTSNASETITLSGGEAGHVVLTRDVGLVSMDVNGIERIAFGGAGGGVDRFVLGDLTGSDVRQLDIDLGLFGGGGGDGQVDTVAVGGAESADHIVFTNENGAVTVGGLGIGLTIRQGESADRFAVSTGSGDDRVDVSHLGGGIGVVFDGGEGSDSVIANGSGAADTIFLAGNNNPANPDGDPIVFSIDGVSSQLSVRNVETLTVDAGDGDDLVSAESFSASSALVIGGGSGNDTLTGGFGSDTLDGGVGNDLIDGSRGPDLMRGGDGDDTFIWNPGDGSDIVDGGKGDDTLAFNTSNATETIGLFAGAGGHAFLTRDIAAIRMDLNDIEHVTISGAGGGADRFAIGNLTGTGIHGVDIDLRLPGFPSDGQSDTISVTSLTSHNDHLDIRVAGFETHASTPEGDVMVLNGFSDHTFADAVAHQHIFQSGSDVILADGSGLVVTMQGVSLAALHASDFLFG